MSTVRIDERQPRLRHREAGLPVDTSPIGPAVRQRVDHRVEPLGREGTLSVQVERSGETAHDRIMPVCESRGSPMGAE